MRRLALTLAAACAAALVVVLAPALSTRPYQAEPVEFELAPRADSLLGKPVPASAKNAGVVSKPLPAPKRFNLVGMRWSGGGELTVAIRTRKAGGRWSRWAALDSDEDHNPDPGEGEPTVKGVTGPAWVGEADFVQYRMSKRVRGLRLHFVNTRGTSTRAERALSAVRRVANSTVAAVVGLASANAAEQQPAIVPRRDWGSSNCPPRDGPSYGQVQVGFVHHTVTTNDYSPADAPSIVLGICRFHRNSNGWDDIGYNFLVDKFGTIYEGRAGGVDQPVIGAQVAGLNTKSFGVANIGDFSRVNQGARALRAMARLIRWKLPLHGVPTSGRTRVRSASGASLTLNRVSGHRDGNSTACPGDALYAQLPSLRRLVGGIFPDERVTRLRAIFRPGTITSGGRVRVAVRLRRATGAPVGGARILIQRRRRGRWSRVGSVRTNAEGFARTRVRMSVTRRLRARFEGTSSLRASRSRSKVIRVRPRFAFARKPPRRVSPGEQVRVRGTIKPRKRRVLLVVQRLVGGRYRRVVLSKIRVRRGRFTAAFVMRRTGRHRFFIVFPGDDFNARGRTRRYRFEVVAEAGPGGGALSG